MNPSFKSLLGQAIVEAFRIIKPGTADDTCVKATGSTEHLLGTSDSLDKAAGELVDMDLRPEGEVRLGGTVARGDWLTSDANGKAISATPGAGVNCAVIGRASVSGVADDVIRYYRALGRIQG